MSTHVLLTTTKGVTYRLHDDTTVEDLWDLVEGPGGGPEYEDPIFFTKADGKRLITKWGYVQCLEEVSTTTTED